MPRLDAHLGRPLVRGPLTLFPVFVGNAVCDPGYVLAPDVAQVDEREGAPVVGQLVVTNPGPLPALVLEADLLLGGQQDRVAARSAMVPARQRHVLEVYCTESGRWGGPSSSHQASRRRAPMEVRAALTADQGEVWRRVDRYGQRYGSGSTSALRDAADNGHAAAGALVEGLKPLFGQCGLLVGVGGQPLLFDAVDTPSIFARLWQPLLEAVALDAIGVSSVPTPGRRARRFLERLLVAPRTASAAQGEGRHHGARSRHADVRSLSWRSRTVHVSAYNVRHPLLAG